MSYQKGALLLGGILAVSLFLILLFVTEWGWYLAWLIAINLTTFALFGIDKASAKAGKIRIPEIALHIFTLAGGFLGQFAGRLIFHHKTNFGRHPSFTFIPIISLVLWGVIGYLVYF
jgi:uncharacterized membrane protein YsdA (DUF1294 family)